MASPRKSERLINLVICLLAARRLITREEIRASVDGYSGLSEASFQRTFERDKDELRALGLPLEVGPTDAWSDGADGYRIRRTDFELPALKLTAAESTLVGLAARVWQEAALADATSRAITKLKAAGVAVTGDRLVAVAPALPSREPAFNTLWQGWLTRTPVTFTYHGQARVFEPWKLILRQGQWYAVGRDRAAGPRLFKLSRITDTPQLVTGEPPFATVSPAELATQANRLAEPEATGQARLAIQPDAAPALRRRGQRLDQAGPAGYNLFTVPYARDSDIVDEAAAAGAAVLVLDPPALRAQVVERLSWVAHGGERSRSSETAVSVVKTATDQRKQPPAEARSEETPRAVNRPAEVPTAAAQVARLLLLIPYLQTHPGISLAEVATTFQMAPEQVRQDLTVAFMCGLPGGLPGDLIDVDLDLVDDEGVIYLTNADVLRRPLRLSPDEAMGLIVALQAVREVGPNTIAPTIDGLLDKLAAVAPAQVAPPTVTVAAGQDTIRAQLLRAISQAEQVELTYDGLSRGQTTKPVVDPVRLLVEDGVGYLSAWSWDRQAWRTYRLDRVVAVRPTGQLVVNHGDEPEPGSWLRTLASAPPVRLLVHAAGQWIREYYPVTGQVSLPNGDIELTLPVADPAWLRWLLLRLGPAAEVIDAPTVVADLADVARQALAAYDAAGLGQ
ncbi:MAG: WYL domain-containing protein [Propionibacteriaceae bacterium]|jgi:proteasome accessory factor B/proteasome accessory factor C|nr:WYL domain-containing protein [Propionibacteriaceae bacterium]